MHLAANVTNLPLRPPAVLARSVASLDLLSGGRVELGLGAGAFWDAIEAMGGRRLTPGQGVRGAGGGDRGHPCSSGTPRRAAECGSTASTTGWWAPSAGPLRPTTSPIWLGAYKPRMLQLTGRLADGWLPTLGYLRPGDLAKGNAIIDDAAAGRPAGPRRTCAGCSTSPASSRPSGAAS